MYLVETAQKSEVERASSSKETELSQVTQSEIIEATESDSSALPFSVKLMFSMIGGSAVLPLALIGLYPFGIGDAEIVPLTLALGASVPMGFLGWSARRRLTSLGRSLSAKLKSGSKELVREVKLPAESRVIGPVPTVAPTVVSSRRTTGRVNPYRKAEQKSLYGESYWQGYMDSIYCDYEDNHLEKSSNHNHY